jgi:beta-galactosidase/beta-glucuronidase
LEATGASRIEYFRIDAELDGRVKFDGRVAGAAEGLDFHYRVKSEGRVIAVGSAPVRGKYAAAGTWIREPRLWSLAQPNLYDVEFELRKGDTAVDHVDSYFGIRKVAVERGRVTLNGQPVYLKLVLDQGYWPESLLTPPSDEAIQYDLKMTKEMGFNGARKHQKVEDPRYLYWADKLGLIISGEMANAYLFDEQYAARFTREWMECLERDINHPSILIWAPINESWGVPRLVDVRQQAHLRSLYHLTKTFDPTRLVIDNEGWEHLETTDLFAVHDYAPTLDALMSRWKVFVEKKQLPPHGREYLIPGHEYNGSPLYLSEFGGIAYIPPGTQAAENAWGYSGVEKTTDAVITRLSGQYNAIQSLPFVGICYTQLTDVEQEMNGLLTYDRKPKFDSKRLKEFNDRLK